MERENAWKKYEGEKQKEVFDFAEGYKAFLTKCKTERECTEEIIRQGSGNLSPKPTKIRYL